MTAAAAKKKQTEIPGTERETIPELEEIAIQLAEARYRRMELQEEESDLHQQMLDRMEAVKDKITEGPGKVPTYVCIDGENKYVFRLKSLKKVSIERTKTEG